MKLIKSFLLLSIIILNISCIENSEAALVNKYFSRRDAAFNKHGELTALRILRDEIEGVQYFKKLEILDLYSNHVKDLSQLEELKELKDIYIVGLDTDDISPLSGLIKLYYLGISRSNITDLKPLDNLVNLEELGITSEVLKSANGISRLKKLKSLRLDSLILSDITAVGELTSLEHLEITYSKELIDISPIGRLKKLKYLKLTGCGKITDISPLIGCDSLEEVTIENSFTEKSVLLVAEKVKSLKVMSGDMFSPLKEKVLKIRPDIQWY